MSDTPETNRQWAEWLNKLKMPIESFVDFARRLERERDEAREALEIATDQLVQAQAALREIHTIVQLRFAEWAPANDMNDGREEAAK